MAKPTRLLGVLTLLFIYCLVPDLKAQTNLTAENADCYGAVVITDSVFGPVFPGRGPGHVVEIRDNADDDPMYLEKEHHSIWYKFRAPWDCDMTFDIVPMNQKDDIDFMLFRGAVVDICQEIYRRSHKPVRSNIGRNDPTIGSRSGLSHTATENYVQSGPTDHPYSKSVQAKKGEQFFLLVDQLTAPRGPYTIHFHFGPQPESEVVEDEATQKVVIRTIDADTKQAVSATLAVEGVKLGEVLELEGKSEYELFIKPYRSLKVSGVKKGYLIADHKMKPANDSVIFIEIPMTALRAGTQFSVTNINFVGDKATILRSSFKAVKEIELFLKENDLVRVQIQGHVNGPNRRNSKVLQNLSEQRAKAVYDRLVKSGVAADRMEYTGFGNTQMIYKEPKYSHESEVNRRVEFKILENKGFQEEVAESVPSSPK